MSLMYYYLLDKYVKIFNRDKRNLFSKYLMILLSIVCVEMSMDSILYYIMYKVQFTYYYSRIIMEGKFKHHYCEKLIFYVDVNNINSNFSKIFKIIA